MGGAFVLVLYDEFKNPVFSQQLCMGVFKVATEAVARRPLTFIITVGSVRLLVQTNMGGASRSARVCERLTLDPHSSAPRRTPNNNHQLPVHG
ncbi:hypothetical protein CRUP_006400 [Coryphaenoides rupestris]|nr:hypothetical protein CRUP_006400 [Coryphaenoides rupestris]